MLVLVVLKEGLNCDWDRLHELVNQHGTLREMLGDSRFGGERYHRQTLIDNVSLLRPELLRAVGERVVSTGHEVVRKESCGGLSARCDSFVVETDVRFPTDLGLLWDATRVAMRVCSKLAKAQGLAGWRQRRHLERQLRHRFQRVCTSRRWKRDPQGRHTCPVVDSYGSGLLRPWIDWPCPQWTYPNSAVWCRWEPVWKTRSCVGC